ncbi:MAG: hypothetical protein E7369_00550 [Clostridiales bacterium]|nr:hypothetical protein [Clostridiales bacterium]
MTVYIEYVLIDNFVLDYLFLKATFHLTNIPSSKGRLLFCAFLGSVFALIYPLIRLGSVGTAVIKILFGLLLTLISGKFKTKKEYYVCTLIFFCLTTLTGGGIIAVYNLIGLNYSSELSIGLMILPAYAILKIVLAVIKYIYSRKAVVQNVYKCELSLGGRVVVTDGFMDTGNMLYDGDTPVIVCDKRVAKELFSGDTLPKIKRITFSTVSGKSTMMAITINSIKIYFDGHENIYNKVTLGVAKNSVGTGYGVILHPALEKDYAKLNRDDKNVS